MYLVKKAILFLIILPTLIFSEIIETNSFEDISQHIIEGTLIISDLDNTVFRAKRQFGSSEWADHIFQEILRTHTFDETLRFAGTRMDGIAKIDSCAAC